MKHKTITLFVFVFVSLFAFTACNTPNYDFDAMAKNLQETYGEEYEITFKEDTVYITRTYTLPKNGRTREDIANLSAEEFDDWANGFWFLIGNEQKEYEETFKENGDNYEVLITYQIIDGNGNEIGCATIHGCEFTLEDLSIYRTID